MAFGFKDAALGLNPVTGPGYWAAQLAGGSGGGGGGYAPDWRSLLENPNNAVDQTRIMRVFQQVLGRSPDQNEMESLSRYIKNGDLDYHEIEQLVSGLPEASRSRLESDTTAYGNRLGASDNEILGRAGDTAVSQFARLGRGETSGIGAQLASAGRDLAMSRQQALADFYGRGLQGIQGQYQMLSQGNLDRGRNLADSRTAYNRQLSTGAYGYQTQKADYDNYLGKQNQANLRQGLMQGAFQLGAAGLGAAFAGPAGATVASNLAQPNALQSAYSNGGQRFY
jgi:hypothetical protein